MRITNSIIERSSLANLQRNLANVVAAQAEVSSGLRVQKMSDDPTAASQALDATSSRRAIVQYQRNIDAARTRTRQEDQALGSLSDLITRAKELGIAQGGGTATAATRQTAKAEVDQLLAQAVSIGNTRSGNSYLFGGLQSQTAPFALAAPPFIGAMAPVGQAQTEISSGQLINSTHDGQQVFISSGALPALYILSQALGNDDAAAIQASLSALDNAFDGIQHLIGDVGAWDNQLQVTSSNLEALDTNLSAHISTLTDADTEEAMTALVSRQSTYQAAMLATSRILGLTLTDYLR